jgi:tight adherence protein B
MSRAEREARRSGQAVADLARRLRAGAPPDRAVAEVAAALAAGRADQVATAWRAAALRLAAGQSPAAAWAAVPFGRFLTAVWELSAELGTPVGPGAQQVAAAVRDDAAVRRAAAEAFAPARATGMLLAALPLLAVGLGWAAGAHPGALLAAGPAGRLCLAGGAVLELAGVAWCWALLRRGRRGPGSTPPARRPRRPRGSGVHRAAGAPTGPAAGGPAPAVAVAVVGAAALGSAAWALPLPGVAAVLAATAVAVAGRRAAGRGGDARRREALAASLPEVCALLAWALAAGAGPAAALAALTRSWPPWGGDAAVRDCWERVAGQLAGGAPVAQALAPVTDGLATPRGRRRGGGAAERAARDLADGLVLALRSCLEAGAAPGWELHRLAADARADQLGRARARAAAVGVWTAAPLGLCFLPAFALLGVLPTVAGLLRP